MLVEIREVGDNQTREQGFRLLEPATLHVEATGEAGAGELVDAASIVERASRRAVWRMRESDTVPAGGARKNRRFDGLVRLERGEYVLVYRTDDSHSHPRWNAAAPFDPRAWGVRLAAAPGARRPAFELVGPAGR